MELVYPFVIYIGIIGLIILTVIRFKKNSLYENGKKIANTKYIKEIPYYKQVLKRYKIFSVLIKIMCILSIFMSLILLARPIIKEVDNSEMYNRDIFLCMDVSASIEELNKELVKTLKQTVNSLKGERFGITIFNTTSVLLVPLTDDYEYVLDVLDTISESFNLQMGDERYFYLRDYIIGGTVEGAEERGGSNIGDGLASCASNFIEGNEDRTKIIILSTDNQLYGKPILTLDEAAKVCKDRNIRVYGIATSTITEENEIAMKNAVELTGGRYYKETDYSGNGQTVPEIVGSIEQTQKSLFKGNKKMKDVDKPEVPFVILCISIMILFGLENKVKG